jgi:hypothetical protein
MDLAEANEAAMALDLDRRQVFSDVLVQVPVAMLEEAFALCPKQWLGPGAEGRAGARARAVAALEEGRARAPSVMFGVTAEGVVRARFEDGRHRFCVLRDAGATRINIGVTPRWAEHLEDVGAGLVVGRRDAASVAGKREGV